MPAAAPGWAGHPQDLRPARRPPGGYGEAGLSHRRQQDPAIVVRGVRCDFAGNIAGEVVRPTADDGRDGWNVRGGEAADGEHDIILRRLAATPEEFAGSRPPAGDPVRP